MPTLLHEVEARQTALLGLLERAANRDSGADQPGEMRVNADRFLAATSRHLAASTGVLLPAVKDHLAGGGGEVRDFARRCKRLERTLVTAHAKLYGQAQCTSEPWSSVWSTVGDQLAQTARAERRLVATLGEHLDSETEARLRHRFTSTVGSSQTRPHPHLPHTGVAGRVARWLCGKIDLVWDELQGRVTSEARPLVRTPDNTA
ncbi:hypothetical protein [Nocardioides aquiterrae]|uniref:hypothetical protein n=1 Tax=Nocardioides aquiterrae TaxID=203799 RepID=UPI0031E1171A